MPRFSPHRSSPIVHSAISLNTTFSHFSLYDHHLLHNSNSLRSLQQIHASLSVTGFIYHRHLRARLILNYSNLCHLIHARNLFDEISTSSSFLWNTIIRGYATSGVPDNEGDKADGNGIDLYVLMRRAGVQPNNYTFPFVLKSCGASSVGKCIHCDVLKIGFASDGYVEAALVDLYGKRGEIADGRKVFDGMLHRDLVCWTAMITAYEKVEMADEALELVMEMIRNDIMVDRVTMISVGSAVAQLRCRKKAQSVHSYMLRRWFLENIEAGNMVIFMYTKCGDLDNSRLVFNGMIRKDVISWNSMLSGYTQNGHAKDAMSLFMEMRNDRHCHQMIHSVTALNAVTACAHLGSLNLAKQMHGSVITSCEIKAVVGNKISNGIIDMYAKCGDLESAFSFFTHSRSSNDVNSWNVIITAYGIHGHGKEAMEIFRRMQSQHIKPDHITITSLLSACSHSGLVEQGKKFFHTMRKDLGISPTAKHYACVIDMLARAGQLEEAYMLINQMEIKPNGAIWGALLGGCRIHGNADLGELAAKMLFELDPDHSGYYVLMSNTYADTTRWAQACQVRESLRRRGLKKPVGYSAV